MKGYDLSYVDLLARVGETNRCPGGKRTVRDIARRLGVGPATRVLEIGANTGFTSIELAKITGCTAVGIDVNESAVSEARRNASRLGGGLADRIEFLVADACDIPFEDGEFDLLVCGGANTFIQQRERAFAEYWRVLRPYGFVSVTNLFYRTAPDPELTGDLADVLGFPVPPHGLADWLRILVPDGWELYGLSTTDLMARSPQVIDAYVDRLCGANLSSLDEAARAAITEQWRHVMHVFNRNHAHLSYMELDLRRDDVPEQPEVFLGEGRYDPFIEQDFLVRSEA
ncbi:MAG: class I SAM-dependent methyltransferase [Streptomyces sp.]|nr:class I SAM-dependent methyltransferase [Streptomyces sp.]